MEMRTSVYRLLHFGRGEKNMRATIPLFTAALLSGCGTFVPNIQEFPYSSTDALLMVKAINQSVLCELRHAVTTVIDSDIKTARRFDQVRVAKWFDDWGVQVGLTLTIAEKTKVNPSAVWTPTSIFTLKGGVGATATATRISKMNSYSPVATLYDASKDKQNSDRKECKGKGAGSLLITSDLKITEWLMAQVLVIGTGSSVGVPTSSSSPLRVHLRINEPCEPSCHDLDHGDLDETRCALGVSFEIPGHAPVCGDPGQRTLDDPALGQDHETLCCV